jgi:regulatory subunit for Cdc7p protein kinase
MIVFRCQLANRPQHVVARKHRKFAATIENWAELDSLLAQLDRQ